MTASLEAWQPAVQDIANLVPQRTGDRDGDAQGTFTDDGATVPSGAQVQGLVRGVQSEVLAVVGAMPEALCVVPANGTIGESPAGHVVALGAAALVESQFFPDLQAGADSAAAVLERRYRAALAALAAAVRDLDAGTDPGGRPMASAAFPATVALGLATTPWEAWHHHPLGAIGSTLGYGRQRVLGTCRPIGRP